MLVWNNEAIENTLWLQLLLPFTAVKNLYLSMDFAPGIAAALQELVVARITEVLPSLQNIFVKGLEPSGAFQKTLGNSLTRDSSPVTSSPFLTGIKTTTRRPCKQPVSYSACSLAITFILYHSSQSKIFMLLLKLTSESPLTSSFLLNSPFLPLSLSSTYRTLYRALPDASPHIHLHTYVGVRVAPVNTHCL